MKRIVLFLFLTIYLAACAPVGSSATEMPESISMPSVTLTITRTVPPTASPTASPTRTLLPVRWTDIPTPTRAPTATIAWPDLPPLNPDGPYILWKSRNHGYMLINADGSGMARLNLPYREVNGSNSETPGWFLDAGLDGEISPDGEWLVFYKGDIRYSSQWDEEEEMTLRLVHVPDGKVGFSAVVIPDSAYRDRYDSYDCGIWYYDTHFGLSAWSPDGRYLAYPAYADSGTSDLFVLDTHNLSVRRLTNDPAEIEAFRWSPDGDRIYFTNGNEFDVGGASFSSYTLNYTQPGNATNQGMHTIAVSKDQLLVKGFDRDTGVIYATHENNRCQNGTGSGHWIKEVFYFKISSGESSRITSGERNIRMESFLVDTVNRAIFFTDVTPYQEWGLTIDDWPDDRTMTVSFEGNTLVSMDPEIIRCANPVLLSGTRYAYICRNAMDGNKTTGITFGGTTVKVEVDGAVYVSPDGKWFLVLGKDSSLFSHDGKLVRTWEGEESFDYGDFFWYPNRKGIAFSNDGKEYRHFDFDQNDTSVGGKKEKMEAEDWISVSPNRKWFLVLGKDTSLFSRDGQLVRTWEGEESFGYGGYFWDPSGKGIYFSSDDKQLRFYSFVHDKTPVIFTCPFADGCYLPGIWIP